MGVCENGHTSTGAKFCPQCGAKVATAAPAQAGSFCSDCGFKSASTFCAQCGKKKGTPPTKPTNFCEKCGIESSAKFCPSCGSPKVGGASTQSPAPRESSARATSPAPSPTARATSPAPNPVPKTSISGGSIGISINTGSSKPQAMSGPPSSNKREVQCAACGQVIAGRVLLALDESWHPACFTCVNCLEPQEGKPFYVQDDNVYCEKDYDDLFALKCQGCKKIIEGQYLRVPTLKQIFHPDCLVCTTCKTPLKSKTFFCDDNSDEILCQKDYETRQTTVRCAHCSNFIQDGVVRADGKTYHGKCYDILNPLSAEEAKRRDLIKKKELEEEERPVEKEEEEAVSLAVPIPTPSVAPAPETKEPAKTEAVRPAEQKTGATGAVKKPEQKDTVPAKVPVAAPKTDTKPAAPPKPAKPSTASSPSPTPSTTNVPSSAPASTRPSAARPAAQTKSEPKPEPEPAPVIEIKETPTPTISQAAVFTENEHPDEPPPAEPSMDPPSDDEGPPEEPPARIEPVKAAPKATEPKSEPKAAEPKSEPKAVEPKSEPKAAETKSEPKAETKSEPVAPAKPTPTPGGAKGNQSLAPPSPLGNAGTTASFVTPGSAKDKEIRAQQLPGGMTSRDAAPTQSMSPVVDDLAGSRPANKTLSAMQARHQMTESEDAIPYIMHGLKYVLHSSDVSNEVFVPDYRKKEMYKLVHLDKKYDFQHYAPSVFNCVRNLFGITQQLYYKSLVETGISGGKLGDGKSGMLFFYSNDRRFVIKTITRPEIVFFKSILRNYLTHVVKNKHTLLPRFFGAYKITLPDQRKLRLCVMNNLYETTCRLDEKYDLKGSTRNRYVDVEKYGRGGVLKDLNFHDAIYLGTAQKRAVMAQLKKDTQFLVDENVMDQSLLLGIHNAGAGNPVTTAAEYRPVELGDFNKSLTVRVKGLSDLDSCFQRFKGGLVSMCDNPTSDHHLTHIYFFGIIDILQEFNAKKRMESTYKCIRYNKKAISAVSSKAYATRFLEYMDQCIK